MNGLALNVVVDPFVRANTATSSVAFRMDVIVGTPTAVWVGVSNNTLVSGCWYDTISFSRPWIMPTWILGEWIVPPTNLKW